MSRAKQLEIPTRGGGLPDYLNKMVAKYGGIYWPFQETAGAVSNCFNSALATGRDLVINGGFANWTGDSLDNWTQSPADGANNEVCEVATGESHADCGTPGGGHANIWRSGGAVTYIRQTLMTVGKSYTITTDIDTMTSGTIRVRDSSAVLQADYTTAGIKTLSGTAGDTKLDVITVADPTDTTIDSIMVQQTGIPANDANMDGAITSATVGQAGPGVGGVNFSYLFDGANDFVNVYSPELNSFFDPTQGTLLCFAKVSGAGVWTDGIWRYIGVIGVDVTTNFITILKKNTNNNLMYVYEAGNIQEEVTQTVSTTDWFLMGITWDTAVGMKAWYNGVQTGSTQAIAGTWVGNLASTNTVFGALNTTPGSVWSGYLAYPMLFRDALSAPEILQIAALAGVA